MLPSPTNLYFMGAWRNSEGSDFAGPETARTDPVNIDLKGIPPVPGDAIYPRRPWAMDPYFHLGLHASVSMGFVPPWTEFAGWGRTGVKADMEVLLPSPTEVLEHVRRCRRSLVSY